MTKSSGSRKVLSEKCPRCNRHTVFKEMYSDIMYNDDPQLEYTFASCGECGQFALFTREYPEGLQTEYYRREYPPKRRNPTLYTAPVEVLEAYIEAIICEESHTWLATVTMVRRTLEAICKQFIPNPKSIFEGLRELNKRGIISDELHTWADVLRDIGNIGAHVKKTRVTKEDAEDSLDFLEAILETLYYHRPKFEFMKNRRTLQNLDLS